MQFSQLEIVGALLCDKCFNTTVFQNPGGIPVNVTLGQTNILMDRQTILCFLQDAIIFSAGMISTDIVTAEKVKLVKSENYRVPRILFLSLHFFAILRYSNLIGTVGTVCCSALILKIFCRLCYAAFLWLTRYSFWLLNTIKLQ